MPLTLPGPALLLIWIWYGAAALLIGGAAAYLAVSRWVRRDRPEPGVPLAIGALLRRVSLAAAATLVAAALARIAVRTLGEAGTLTLDAMTSVASGSSWGTGWWAQLYVALLAMAGLLIAGRRPRQGWSLATAAALGAAYTLPMTGAGGAAGLDRLPLALAALHTFLAGVWVGVPLLTGAAIRATGAAAPPGLRAAAKWTLALGAGGAVLTGLALVALAPRSPGAIFTSGYATVLALKLAAAALLGYAALARPRLALAAAAVALIATAALAN